MKPEFLADVKTDQKRIVEFVDDVHVDFVNHVFDLNFDAYATDTRAYSVELFDFDGRVGQRGEL